MTENTSLMQEPFPIDVADAVCWDMRLHGARFILIEFAVATLFFAVLAAACLPHAGASRFLLGDGLFFASTAVNCLTILALAVRQAHRDVPAAGSMERLRRYTVVLSLLILLPIALPALTLAQLRRTR